MGHKEAEIQLWSKGTHLDAFEAGMWVGGKMILILTFLVFHDVPSRVKILAWHPRCRNYIFILYMEN